MPLVRFNVKGRWADAAHPKKPIINVDAGDEVEVSPELAEVIVEAGRGEVVTKKGNPAKKDKAKADKG